MKPIIATILTTLTAGLLTGCSTPQHESPWLIQGRSVSAWVKEVEIGGAPGNTNLGLDVLISTGPAIMPELTRILSRHESSDEQAKAAYAMGAIACRNRGSVQVREAVPSLIKAAHSSNSAVRIHSVQALGAAGKAAKEATPVLLRLAKDENASVRMCAVEALGRIGATTPESLAALKIAMSDPSGDVQITAIEALCSVGQPPTDAIPALIRLTRNESISVRCAAVEALGRVGGTNPEAIAAVNTALSDSSAFVRGIAKQTSSSFQGDRK